MSDPLAPASARNACPRPTTFCGSVERGICLLANMPASGISAVPARTSSWWRGEFESSLETWYICETLSSSRSRGWNPQRLAMSVRTTSGVVTGLKPCAIATEYA